MKMRSYGLILKIHLVPKINVLCNFRSTPVPISSTINVLSIEQINYRTKLQILPKSQFIQTLKMSKSCWVPRSAVGSRFSGSIWQSSVWILKLNFWYMLHRQWLEKGKIRWGWKTYTHTREGRGEREGEREEEEEGRQRKCHSFPYLVKIREWRKVYYHRNLMEKSLFLHRNHTLLILHSENSFWSTTIM